jgi:putative ABC transport system permease protein
MNSLSFPFTLAARYLAGRKLRTALTTLSIVFGVTVFFGLGLLVPSMNEAFRRNLTRSAGAVDLTLSHVSGGSFDAATLDAVRDTAGVARATGLLERSVLLPSGTAPADRRTAGAPAGTIGVVGLDPTTAPAVRAYSLAAGRFLVAGDTDAVVIPASLANRLGLAPGDPFTLPSASGTATFRIVGIVAQRPAAGAEAIYVPLPAAQALFNQPAQINLIEALLAPGADPNAAVAALRARLGDGFRPGGVEAGAELRAGLALAERVYGAIGLMALLAGAFIIYNTFRTGVAERRHDLATLRAVGATRRTILGVTLAESLTQGLVGTAAGLVAGYGLAAGALGAMGALARDLAGLEYGWPAPTLPVVALAVLLGLGITLVGALAPAFAAARVTPLEGLRRQTGGHPRGTAGRQAWIGGALVVLAALGLSSGQPAPVSLGTALFLVGLVLLAPAAVRPIAGTFGRLLGLLLAREGQLARGNLARQPGRAAITASTMMVGLAIALALIGMFSSLVGGFRGYLGRSLGADFLIMPSSLYLGGGNVGAGPDLAQRLRETPGVGALTTLRLAKGEAPGVPFQVIGIDPSTHPTVSGLAFSQGDAGQTYAALGRGRAIILNPMLAAQLGAGVGQIVTLRTPAGDRPYAVAGVGVDYLNAKLSTGFVSQADLARDFHETSDVLLLVNAAPGADPAALGRALERALAGYPALSLLTSADFRASQEAILVGTEQGMYALLLAILIPGLLALVNTLAINVVERTREIGTLRAVGTTRRQVRRMILGESILLATTGIAFGILAGLWLGYVLVLGLNATAYPIAYDFPWAGILASVAVGLLIGVLAAVIPARQAARLPIVAALRYE